MQGFKGLFVLLFAAITTLSFCQTSTTSVRGTVTDQKGAVVSGATVTLTNPATGTSSATQTNNQGEYQFLQIKPGTYNVSATAPGFATVQAKNVEMLVATPATVNLALSVQSVSATVEVSATAATVNTQDATIGNAFTTAQIMNLPSEGRDPVGILSLQPGVAYVGRQDKVQQDSDSRGGSVDGARSDQTNIVLDGVDNNDQTRGYSFQGALRSTLDSVQEFRVTTTSSNADAGRSSGAQVVLVTKSGTNNFHGSLYEYHRPTITTANDWFNKNAQVSEGLPNRAPKYIRNTYGASVGGPIIKNRFFFFGSYEGQRKAESIQVTRTVPSETLRQGIIRYACDTTDPNCSLSNPLVSSTPQGLVATLGPAQILQMDPVQNLGVDPASLAIMQSYPEPNTDLVSNGDFLNVRGFTFAAPSPAILNTYIAKLDYNITQNGNHRLFVRGNLMGDKLSRDPQFPGKPPRLTDQDNSKGIAVGYTALLGNNKVNNFRYAFVRQGTSSRGVNAVPHVTMRFFDNFESFDRTQIVDVPVHTVADDFSWTRGHHTIQIGGNWRLINNIRVGDRSSFSGASTNQFWLNTGGVAGKGTSLDPAVFGFPAVDPNVGAFGYDASIVALVGVIPEVDQRFNLDKNANLIPEGQPLHRHFRANELEPYIQDAWHVTPNLTVTAGVRYTLLQPPYETSGTQVSPSFSLHDFVNQRALHMLAGQPFVPQISFDLSGQANGKKPYWNWDYKDVAPRVAFAYSPSFDNGVMKSVFGGAGKTSIRGGWGIYYDHFGQGVVDTFDSQGSFGLNSEVTNSAAVQSVDCAPRLTSAFTIPSGTFCGQNLSPAPPQGPFPITPPANLFAITWGLDDRLKTPYSHAFDLSVQRDLGKGFVFETAYIGRLGRRLLQQRDLAMPLDLRDPSSGMDYFAAATQLVKLAEAGTPVEQVGPIPYWQNLFPAATGAAAAGLTLGFSSQCSPGSYPTGASPTQAVYELYNCFLHNETTSLFSLDGIGGPCIPACSIFGPNTFFHNQYSSLWAWTSEGTSSYNGLQAMLRRKTGALQFDFNYTYSKSIDLGSDAERNGFMDPGYVASPSFFPGQIINTWNPRQMRGVSDFDTTHNINGDWTYDMPYGKGRNWSSGNAILENIFGGWSLNGVYRWSSGFPFSVAGGSGDFPTNWELTGQAVPIAPLPQTGQFNHGGIPNIFKDPTTAGNAFRFAHPGESGVRNNLRGPGYFGVDMGLGKSWKITESQALRFSWEVFNVTNSVRFDVGTLQANNATFNQASFGTFVAPTLTLPRVMQFSLRYSF